MLSSAPACFLIFPPTVSCPKQLARALVVVNGEHVAIILIIHLLSSSFFLLSSFLLFYQKGRRYSFEILGTSLTHKYKRVQGVLNPIT